MSHPPVNPTKAALAVVAIVLFIAAGVFLLAGCGGSGRHHGPHVNKYLVDCFVEDDGTVTVEIALPEDHFGFLFIEDSVLAFPPVVNSGVHNLGFLPEGDTTLVLRLERELLPSGEFTPNFTGVEEFCTFYSPGEPVAEPEPDPEPEPEPEPEPDPTPTFACHVNLEGGVTITIELNGAEGCILRRVGDAENDIYVMVDDTVTDAVLAPGTYTFRLLDLDGEAVFAECIVEIPDPEPDDDDEEDDCDLEKKERYTLCYKGRCIIAKGKRACRLLAKGATFGPCDDDDSDD